MTTKTARNRQLIDSIKLTLGCKRCPKGTEHPAHRLQFDHLPGEKKLFNVAHGLSRSVKSLLNEIAKCQVVCANHHSDITQERRNG